MSIVCRMPPVPHPLTEWMLASFSSDAAALEELTYRLLMDALGNLERDGCFDGDCGATPLADRKGLRTFRYGRHLRCTRASLD